MRDRQQNTTGLQSSNIGATVSTVNSTTAREQFATGNHTNKEKRP